MNARYPLLWISFAVLGLAIAVDVLFPQFETLVFYGLLFWLIGSFFFFRSPGLGRPAPGGSGASSALSGAAPRLDEPIPSGPPVSLAFCAFCGAGLPPEAMKCPVCKHAVRPF